ncbi:hypothetical protein LIER_37955 [Lithospermum erythrorhizon]|uniref:Transmembrane protein n=1 Tax=Lithospermum erythrorhizon TaxID=34254 RepID=A0AAV3PWM4_LITER
MHWGFVNRGRFSGGMKKVFWVWFENPVNATGYGSRDRGIWCLMVSEGWVRLACGGRWTRSGDGQWVGCLGWGVGLGQWVRLYMTEWVLAWRRVGQCGLFSCRAGGSWFIWDMEMVRGLRWVMGNGVHEGGMDRFV